MEVLYPRCAGLDVNKDTVVACVRCVTEPTHREVRTFRTTTRELFALADWIEEHSCTHAVALRAQWHDRLQRGWHESSGFRRSVPVAPLEIAERNDPRGS
jgi:hypothetical protein